MLECRGRLYCSMTNEVVCFVPGKSVESVADSATLKYEEGAIQVQFGL